MSLHATPCLNQSDTYGSVVAGLPTSFGSCVERVEEELMTRWILILITLSAGVVGCSERPMSSPVQPSSGTTPASATAGSSAVASALNPNGVGGAMPAYYDGQLFTINF